MTTPSTPPHFTVQHPAGYEELVRLAAAQPLTPACDHFYFLRHGQTGRNALRIFQAVDEPLSELGLQQAGRAAALLAGEPIRTLVASDAHRALTTAKTVGAALKLVPLEREDLRERHFGDLIGTSSAAIDWAVSPKNGETLAGFVERKRGALAAALAEPAPVLVVAHGGTLYVLAALLGVAIGPDVLGNAQPLKFERTGAKWTARALAQNVDGGGAIA